MRIRKLGKLFRFLFILGICTVLFGYLVSRAERGHKVKGARAVILNIARFPDLVGEAVFELRKNRVSNLSIKNAYGYCGPTPLQENFIDSNFLLISFFDSTIKQSKIELISNADGQIIHEWIPPEDIILDAAKENKSNHLITRKNFAPYHPLLLDDGAIMFKLVYGPLVKLDKHSNIEWIKNGSYHHSLELDTDGNIWACGNKQLSRYDSLFEFKGKIFEENTLVKISSDGEILFERSLMDIFIKNQLDGLLFGTGEFKHDPFHLNDIQPALYDSEHWQKGDLLLSIRNRSVICLYRPGEDRIIWYKYGPWINQHDVDFVDSTHISLFGNDMVRLGDDSNWYFPLNGFNNLYLIDLETDNITTPYKDIFETSQIYTSLGGRSEILKDGRVLIEESLNGRLLIADKNVPLWGFTKCVSESEISYLFFCRYLYRNNSNLLFD